MVTAKKVVLALGGMVVVGGLLRAARKRRSRKTDDGVDEMEHKNPQTAAEHANAAVEHTRRAVKMAEER